MQRLDLQFYAFSMVVLCGILLGLLFDVLRAVGRAGKFNRWATLAADLAFWSVCTVALSGALFYGNWGELRLYVLVGLLLGLGLYYWLASPVVLATIDLMIRVLVWLVDLLVKLWLRVVWWPLLAFLGLLQAVGRTLWGWMRTLSDIVSEGLQSILAWLFRPLRGPYRYLKLRYLLAWRRLRRRLRRWLG
ncbi:MAG: spore cortex biosynthesis protein YabQ [Mycobacterium leprae]